VVCVWVWCVCVCGVCVCGCGCVGVCVCVCVCVKVKDRNAALTTNQTAPSHLNLVQPARDILSRFSLKYLSVGVGGKA